MGNECCHTEGEGHHKCCWSKHVIVFIGRLLIGFVFLLTAIYSILVWDSAAQDLANRGILYPQIVLGVAILLVLLGSISLILGYLTRVGAVLLVIFIVAVTLIYHNFWQAPTNQVTFQVEEFLKNVFFLGTLLYILGFGPGKISLDHHKCCKICH